LGEGAPPTATKALETALKALTTPNARFGVQLTPSPDEASIIPATCVGVRLGFWDSISPATPATIGVAIEVPLKAS